MGYAQNSLISGIYEMALGRASWDNILDMLSAAFPEGLVLVSGDDAVRRQNLVFSHRGLPPAAAAAYIETYAALNPLLDAQANLPLYQIYHDNHLLPRAEAAQTRFHREWLSPLGAYEAATGVVILREGARQLVLEIRYKADDIAARERAATVLGDAAQHFGRAFEISGRSRFASGRGYLDSVIEDLPFAMFFIDADLRIRYANHQAETLRRQAGSPFASADGVLRAIDVETDSQLRDLVGKTLASKRAPTSILKLNGRDDERYFAIVRPAARAAQHYQLQDAILDPGPMATLVVHGSHDAADLPMDLLWRAFGLTDAEARLADALLDGATLADFAQERAVSKQTLRNQLVGVMRKTGTRRQAELVSLLTRLSLTTI